MIETSTFSAEALLAELIGWVGIESPTYEAAAVNRMQSFIAPRIGALGFTVERLAGRDGLGDILRCRRPGSGEGAGLLLIAHADTVHPVGTLHGKLSVRREGDKCFGPAIYDMKGGTVIALPSANAPCGSSRIAGSATQLVRPILNALTVTMNARPMSRTLARVVPSIP